MDTGTLSLAKVIRGLLITGAVSALPLRGALADTPPDPGTTPPPVAQLGKIEVTGTRIKRADVEAARPITVITQQQIRESGLSSIGDILQLLPSAGAAQNSQFNNGGNGKTNADLRNLGANRLLVLLDGKRVVGGLEGDVDLNTIPAAIIDHVEVLQDGASAVYGSDAISGVVNIITVKHYEGAEANAFVGGYDANSDGGQWDGKRQQYDLTVGADGQRSNVVLNVSYVNESPVYAGNRTISKEPVIGAGLGAASPFNPNGFFDLLTPNGRCPGKATAVVGGSSAGSCVMTLIHSPTSQPTAVNFRNFQQSDSFNYAPANFLVTPSERTGFYVQGRFDLADNLSFKTQVLFNERKSSQQLAPDTLDLGAFGQALSDGEPLSVSAKNPFNPFGMDLVASTSAACLGAGSCDELLLLGRRLNEAGDRTYNQDVRNYRFSGGFSGYLNLLGSEWDWDAGYIFGDNYEGDRVTGVVNTTRMQAELGPAGSAPCANAAAGCTPLNLFGGAGSITPAMLNYFLFEEHDVNEETLRDYTANATGELLDLPAGPLSMALGAEYLQTAGYSHPDALVVQGDTGAQPTPASTGQENTLAQYLEFDVPLVADQPFMKSVDLDLAGRWSQFQWQGGELGTNNQAAHDANDYSGNVSLRWQATDALLLRASWAQGFRIPSISDLFLADSPESQFLTDPCIATPKAAHCGAGPYKLIDAGSGQINTTVGGNNRLTPEHAISQTVGFVYSPDWLAGFDFSADYYKINLSNAIGQVPAQLILNGCYEFALTQDCNLIRRSGGNHSANAPGGITNVENLSANIGGIKTEGVDLSMRYALPSTGVGDFKLGLDWSFTKQYVATLAFNNGYSSQELAGTTTDGAGTAGTGPVTGGIPKQRATLSADWIRGDWSAGWSMEYISGLTEDCATTANNGALQPASRCPLTINFPFESGPVPGNHIGATVYHDVRATYHFDAYNLDLTLGVRNLFDKEPPISMSAQANSYLPTYYRTPGRFLFANVGVKF